MATIKVKKNNEWQSVAIGKTEIIEVPAEPVIEAIEIVENGIFNVPAGVDGYNPITVNVPTGGGVEIPEEAFVFSGDCQYCFSDHWGWFINEYGDKITTKDITNCQSMFYNAQLIQEIPFDINIASTVSSFANMFYRLVGLKNLPYIKGTLKPATGNYNNNPSMQYFIYDLPNLREMPDDYFDTFGGEEFWISTKQFTGNRSNWFVNCYSLRRIPDLNKCMNQATGYSSLYQCLCSTCFTLDEIINLPICEAIMTSNSFSNMATRCCRLKTLTFAVNEDGTPKTAQWKSQTLLGDASSWASWDSSFYGGLGVGRQKWEPEPETLCLLPSSTQTCSAPLRCGSACLGLSFCSGQNESSWGS